LKSVLSLITNVKHIQGFTIANEFPAYHLRQGGKAETKYQKRYCKWYRGKTMTTTFCSLKPPAWWCGPVTESYFELPYRDGGEFSTGTPVPIEDTPEIQKNKRGKKTKRREI